MEIFKENIFGWVILLAVLLILIYTAFIIKNEKRSFLNQANKIKLRHFYFLIPSWWTQVGGDEQSGLIFERTDTRYDWQAIFVWANFQEVGHGPEDLRETLVELIEQKEIIFDADTSIIHNPSDFKDHPAVSSQRLELLRVEGTATEKQTERIYYDAVLIRDRQKQGYLFAQSKSSVLNGPIEGPFFEEVIQNFTLAD